MDVEDIPAVSFLAVVTILCFVGFSVICPDDKEGLTKAEVEAVPARAALEPVFIDEVVMEPIKLKLQPIPAGTQIHWTSASRLSMNALADDNKSIINEVTSEDTVVDITVLPNANAQSTNHLKVTYTHASASKNTIAPDVPKKSEKIPTPHGKRTYTLTGQVGQALGIAGGETVTPEETAAISDDFGVLGTPAELVDLNALFLTALPKAKLKPNQEFTLVGPVDEDDDTKAFDPDLVTRLKGQDITTLSLTYMGTRHLGSTTTYAGTKPIVKHKKSAVFFINILKETSEKTIRMRGEISVESDTGRLLTRKLFGQVDEGIVRRGSLRTEDIWTYHELPKEQ